MFEHRTKHESVEKTRAKSMIEYCSVASSGTCCLSSPFNFFADVLVKELSSTSGFFGLNDCFLFLSLSFLRTPSVIWVLDTLNGIFYRIKFTTNTYKLKMNFVV
ncbi:hypothetical protein HHI36_017780 [Cryptolaemus montrouzieri]|uniref:Uncharacterized protein n=1 Tax=Cryptolaemus montrouzieri TaxID=559131 RepID=A0ABD2NNU5_9CUCU